MSARIRPSKQDTKKGYCKPTYAGSTACVLGANKVHRACMAKIQRRKRA